MGTEESGTAQCHLLRSSMGSLDSHSLNTPGDPNHAQACPASHSIYSAYKNQDGNWGDLGHLHIRVRAAAHDFPTYSKMQLLETETKQM